MYNCCFVLILRTIISYYFYILQKKGTIHFTKQPSWNYLIAGEIWSSFWINRHRDTARKIALRRCALKWTQRQIHPMKLITLFRNYRQIWERRREMSPQSLCLHSQTRMRLRFSYFVTCCERTWKYRQLKNLTCFTNWFLKYKMVTRSSYCWLQKWEKSFLK